MNLNLLGFIKSLVPYLTKNDIIEDVRVTKAELETVTIPAVSQAAEHFKVQKLESPASKALVSMFYRNYTLSNSAGSSNIASEIAGKMKVVLENLMFVETAFEQVLGDDIVTEGLSLKKAILIRAVDQISFISRFTMDFLTVLYAKEAAVTNEGPNSVEAMAVSRPMNERVTDNLPLFARLLSVYGDKKFSLDKRFEYVPDVVLSEKTQSAVIATYGENKLDPYMTPKTSGFFENPIYHLRLGIAEWQANRYKVMKDKKRMLELRVLHLQMLKEKKNDPKVEQEIAYIQSRIEKIEYAMAKAERSVE